MGYILVWAAIADEAVARIFQMQLGHKTLDGLEQVAHEERKRPAKHVRAILKATNSTIEEVNHSR